jgi:hypothetical protein
VVVRAGGSWPLGDRLRAEGLVEAGAQVHRLDAGPDLAAPLVGAPSATLPVLGALAGLAWAIHPSETRLVLSAWWRTTLAEAHGSFDYLACPPGGGGCVAQQAGYRFGGPAWGAALSVAVDLYLP